LPNVLEVSNLRTEFHLRKATVGAVDGISFSVAPGECVGLVGESGCGKSTAGLSIIQLLPNVGHIVGDSSIKLNGRELVGLGEKDLQKIRGNEVAMIFQDPMTSLNPTMTIGRQIAEGVRIHRHATRQEARERALEVLTLVGMPRPTERLDYYPHQLSGGLRQRVMIAMALACDPQLLIADEPTTALDVTIQAQILNLIDDLRQRLNTAVILITHDMGVIAGRTDRVMVMYAGKIVEGAETDELFHHMRHPYASALLQSIPKLDQDATQRLYNIPGTPPDLSEKLDSCRFNPRCPNAAERCRTEEPPLDPDPRNPAHSFACFFPVGSPEGPEPPVILATDEERAAMLERAERRVNELAARRPLLEIQHLVKEFPVTSGAITQRKIGSVKAVSDVSFTVREGETFGLVGESGCGKTTIGRLVVGLERADSGAIKFDSVDVTRLHGAALRTQRRDMQLVFQDPYSSLDPRMRVGSILREPLVVQGIGSRHEQVERVNELISEVGLPRRSLELYPHEFSGGQRQRIGFARALTLNPKLIVADEPVSALDVSIQAQILNMMKGLQQRHQLSYIMISHDLAVVKYLADRIGVMYLGKLMEIGPSQSVYERPAHPYTQALIDAIPVAEPRLARAKLAQTIRGELPSAMDPPSGCRFRTRCPFAQDLCAEEEPQLRIFSSGHFAACHFPLQEPAQEEDVQTAMV
jgi:peptide/nickel transport system ATP-binding protein